MGQTSKQNMLGRKLLKLTEITMATAFMIFLATVLVFFYEDLGYLPTIAIIIIVGALFLPRFLRRNFGTDKNRNIEAVKGIDFQSSIGSFLWTRVDETGFFPYREFVTRFRPKLMRKQLQGKVYHINFRAKCLIVLTQFLYAACFLFIFANIERIDDPLMAIFTILATIVLLIKFCDKTRNFIIRKSAKNINQSNSNLNIS